MSNICGKDWESQRTIVPESWITGMKEFPGYQAEQVSVVSELVTCVVLPWCEKVICSELLLSPLHVLRVLWIFSMYASEPWPASSASEAARYDDQWWAQGASSLPQVKADGQMHRQTQTHTHTRVAATVTKNPPLSPGRWSSLLAVLVSTQIILFRSHLTLPLSRKIWPLLTPS